MAYCGDSSLSFSITFSGSRRSISIYLEGFIEAKEMPNTIDFINIDSSCDMGGTQSSGRQQNRFCFPLKNVIRQSILRVGVLRDLTSSPKKLLVLDRSLESLCTILK